MSQTLSATVQMSTAGVDLSASYVTPTDTEAATTLSAAIAARILLRGGSMTGPLLLAADPTAELQAATKHYVDTSAAAGMPVTGATMTGPLMLSGIPTLALQAAPKQYVDSQVGTTLPLSGGTLTGPLFALASGTSAAMGDNIVTMDNFAQSFSFRRQIESGTPSQPSVYVGLTNASSNYKSYYSDGEYLDVPAMVIEAQTLPGSTGQLNGLLIKLDSGGNNPFDSEDQGLNVQVAKAGQNSTWAINTQSLDVTGLPPQAFATVGAEIDLGGSGYDNPACAYDPYHSYRATMWFNGRPYPWPTWLPSTSYAAGSIVVGTPSGGTASTYIAQNAGRSGTVTPPWSNNGTTTDNGINWAYGTTYAFSIGRGIWFDSNLGPNQFQWGTCISGDAIIQNAFLDTQRVTFATSGGAAIRLSANQIIDFTGNLTAAGQNQHTLQYSTYAGGLAYNIGTGSVATSICLKDDFKVLIAGVTSIANSNKGSLAGTTSGYSPQGLTVGWGYTPNGETDLMVDANGLYIYPVSSAGTTPSSPIFTLNGSGNLRATGSLAAGTTLSVAGIASFGNTLQGNLANVTTGYSPQGLTVGWGYTQNGETDLMVDANGLYIYPVSAVGTIPSSPIFTLNGAGNLKASGSLAAGTTLSVSGAASLANTKNGSLLNVTTGYAPQGLTIGWNYANNGETDLMVDANGLSIYPVSNLGTTPALPIFTLGGSGNVTAFGSLTTAGRACLATGAASSLSSVTSGYNPQGLTVGWSYANNGETDLMVGAGGLNVYTVSSSGVAASTPALTVSASSNILLPVLKSAASYVNDAAAAAGGVPIGQIYRNGSALQMRIS